MNMSIGENILTFVILVMVLYCHRKEERWKSDREWEIGCIYCLIRIANIFHNDCEKCAKKAFSEYTMKMKNGSYRYFGTSNLGYMFISDYKKSIESLKKDYINNLQEKIKIYSRENYNVEFIPNYIIEEYRKAISETYDSFWSFGSDMHDGLWKAANKEIFERSDE